MSYKMYHVCVITDSDHRTKTYREKLESSSEKEVEAKLTELVPLYSVSNVKVFTEVEYGYTGMARLERGNDG